MLKLKIEIPEAFDSLLKPHRYKVMYGGRGSAKSWTVAQLLIARAVAKTEINKTTITGFFMIIDLVFICIQNLFVL